MTTLLFMVIRDCCCRLSQLISGTMNLMRALVATFDSTENPEPNAHQVTDVCVSVAVLFSIRMCVRRLCLYVCIAYVRSSQLRTNNQHPIDRHFSSSSKRPSALGLFHHFLCHFRLLFCCLLWYKSLDATHELCNRCRILFIVIIEPVGFYVWWFVNHFFSSSPLLLVRHTLQPWTYWLNSRKQPGEPGLAGGVDVSVRRFCVVVLCFFALVWQVRATIWPTDRRNTNAIAKWKTENIFPVCVKLTAIELNKMIKRNMVYWRVAILPRRRCYTSFWSIYQVANERDSMWVHSPAKCLVWRGAFRSDRCVVGEHAAIKIGLCRNIIIIIVIGRMPWQWQTQKSKRENLCESRFLSFFFFFCVVGNASFACVSWASQQTMVQKVGSNNYINGKIILSHDVCTGIRVDGYPTSGMQRSIRAQYSLKCSIPVDKVFDVHFRASNYNVVHKHQSLRARSSQPVLPFANSIDSIFVGIALFVSLRHRMTDKIEILVTSTSNVFISFWFVVSFFICSKNHTKKRLNYLSETADKSCTLSFVCCWM